MALLEFWATKPEIIAQMKIDQIVAVAGNQLSDDHGCTTEVRQFLSTVPSEMLAGYAEHCLTVPFTNSGRVLQDIVNELGRRLDFTVTNGRYQGVKGQVGFDGLWKSPEGHGILVEVKTTDAYRIQLKTIAGYHDALFQQGKLTKPSSMLIVVGREDTGELEAQVRGSRYAWDMRLISVDALVKLVMLKQESTDPLTSEKIRNLLVPFDYTRLDEIIEVMFSTVADVSDEESISEPTDGGSEDVIDPGDGATGKTDISAKRAQILEAVATKLGTKFIKKSRATYWDASHNSRLVCSISKLYRRGARKRYWYAYRPSWDTFLQGGAISHVAWGGTDVDVAFLIPRDTMYSLLHQLQTTTPEDGTHYWHVDIVEKAPGHYVMLLPLGTNDLPLDAFQLPLTSLPSKADAR